MTRSGHRPQQPRSQDRRERVTCHLVGVEPGPGGVGLQHECHRQGAETCRADVAMAVHGAKAGPR